MSTPGPPPPATGGLRWRRTTRYGIGLLAVVVLILLIGPRGQSGAPLDPRSTGQLGTRGIIEVLDRLGVETRIDDGVPGGGDGVALVITDDLEPDQRDGVTDWVRQGGRLVVADPYSELAPGIVGLTSVAFTEPTLEPACDDPLVSGVGRVAIAGANVFAPGPDGRGCFPRNDGFWMVRTPVGDGEVIALGGPFTLTNELLPQADTAVLLVGLLTPPDGGLHVISGDSPAGEETLSEVLPDQVWLALAQIPLAWLALVWWRGRRHGRPVEEVSPVRTDAAETTIAVGNLLQRAGRATDAAAIIRGRVHRELSRRLGIGSALDGGGVHGRVVDGEAFVAVAASRTDLPPAVLRRLLLDPLPTDDTGLVAFANAAARSVDGIRQRRRADPSDGSTAPTDPPRTDRSTAP